MKTLTLILGIFQRDFSRYEGVRPIQIYVLRTVFALSLIFVAPYSWNEFINHEGSWKPVSAVAYSIWAAYSTMAVLGIIKPLKMLPIMVFMIFYKVIWLTVVAFPLWVSDTLMGSEAEPMTKDFLWVVLPIVAMPWGYFLKMFFARMRQRETQLREG